MTGTDQNHADEKIVLTHKSPRVLVHGRSSFHSITESLSDELGWRKVWEPLTEVHSFIVCSKLGEFNPVGGKVMQAISLLRRGKNITKSNK